MGGCLGQGILYIDPGGKGRGGVCVGKGRRIRSVLSGPTHGKRRM